MASNELLQRAHLAQVVWVRVSLAAALHGCSHHCVPEAHPDLCIWDHGRWNPWVVQGFPSFKSTGDLEVWVQDGVGQRDNTHPHRGPLEALILQGWEAKFCWVQREGMWLPVW